MGQGGIGREILLIGLLLDLVIWEQESLFLANCIEILSWKELFSKVCN